MMLVSIVILGCTNTDTNSTAAENTSTTISDTTSLTSDSSPQPQVSTKPERDLTGINFSADDQDLAFWAFSTAAIEEVEYYRSIEEMARSATAVVIGRIIDWDETRKIFGEDGEESVFEMPALTVEVLALLHGDLPVGSAEAIRLEPQFSGRGPIPDAPVLMFLRWKGEMYGPNDTSQVALDDKKAYRFVSSQGVLIEIDGIAVNPSASSERRPDPINNEATTMSAIEVVRLVSDLSP